MSTHVQDSDVRSGPDRYVSEIGAAARLGDYLQDYRKPVIITGRKSFAAFAGYTAGAAPDLPVLRYDGSATIRNAHEVADRVAELGADAIVAIGAGKLADTAKNVAEFTGADLIMVPTMAATCAAYSALSVNYDDKHRYVSAPLHPRNSNLVMVDAALVGKAPREFLIGGIGDTLAKWYESVPVFARAGELSAFDRLAQQSARLIRDVLLAEGEVALASYDSGNIDGHLRLVVDVIIGLGGTVGGFGGVRARASGAHAMHDALTLLPGSTRVVHGSKVAYGIIVQLIAEGKEDEARSLLPFYRAVGLPYSFATMGLEPNEGDWRTVAEFAAGPKSAFCLAVPGITADAIIAAMREAERL